MTPKTLFEQDEPLQTAAVTMQSEARSRPALRVFAPAETTHDEETTASSHSEARTGSTAPTSTGTGDLLRLSEQQLAAIASQVVARLQPATSSSVARSVETGGERTPVTSSGAHSAADPWGCLPECGRLTLRQAYEQLLLPNDRRRLAANTLAGNSQTVLPRWEALGSSAPKRWFADRWGQMAYEVIGEPVTNPPVAWIVADDLIKFAWAHLSQSASRRYSASSYGSVLSTISNWLKRLRPQASGGCGALFVVPIVDAAMLPAKVISPRYVPSEEHIQKLFTAAPPDLRMLLACEWLTGVRRGDAKLLTFSHVSEDLQTLSFVANKTQRKRPYPKNLPLHPCMTAWLSWRRQGLAASRLFVPAGERLYPVLRTRRKFDALWKDSLKQAGLSATTVDALGREVEKFTLKRMRAACNVLLNDRGERAGEYVLHSSSKVNDVSYSPVYDPTPEQRRLITTVPVPDWLWPEKG